MPELSAPAPSGVSPTRDGPTGGEGLTGVRRAHEPQRWLFGPGPLLRHLLAHRHLIRQLTRRELAARYRGSLLGPVWALLEPLLLFALYLFVFSVVFQARWGDEVGNRTAYGLNLFAGLVIYNLFAEVVGTSSGLVLEKRSLVKRVIFPLEILPPVRLLAACGQLLLSLVILLAAALFLGTAVSWTVLLVPFVLLPVGLLALGLSYLVASLGVFVRDLATLVRFFVLALLFLSPVFYPLDRLPGTLKRLAALNPLAHAMEGLRAVVLAGRVPPGMPWLMSTLASLLVLLLGFAWFMRSRRWFADVL